MPNITADERARNLNHYLSDILHQYLLACDFLHDDPLADIHDNLMAISKATYECHRIIVNHRRYHKGSDK